MHIINKRRFFHVGIGVLIWSCLPWTIDEVHGLVEYDTSTTTGKMDQKEPIETEEQIIDAMHAAGYPVDTLVATGYTAGVESTGKQPGDHGYGITYAGIQVRRDVYSTIAADLNTYPLGTILYVPGYGYGVVTDIGSAIQGNKIDLYYETVDDVYREWGKQTVDVYVIRKGNGSITEEEIAVLNKQEPIHVFQSGE